MSDGTLGRIALKQVRVSRSPGEARPRDAASREAQPREAQSREAASREAQPRDAAPRDAPPRGRGHPAQRLYPYLDLFARLSDDELSRLARAPTSAVESLRQQVDEVGRALERYADLLPRLGDEELVRLTGASLKTIRFWRRSQGACSGGSGRRSSPDLTPRPATLPSPEVSNPPATSPHAPILQAPSHQAPSHQATEEFDIPLSLADDDA